MSPEFLNYLECFVSSEHPFAPKLSAYCVGGGASLALLMATPGSSKFVSGIYFPYDKGAVASEMDEMLGSSASKRYFDKAVQSRVALDLSEMARRKNADGIGIGITAALTTDRFRKGDTQAFIAFSESDWKLSVVYHVMFDKLPEYAHISKIEPILKRREEDEQIAMLVLSIAYGYNNEFLDKMIDEGKVKEIL